MLKQLENEQAINKSWFYSFETKEQLKGERQTTLFPANPKDIQKVIAYYEHHPVPGKSIKNVQIIFNPTLNHAFALRIDILHQRANKISFAPKWEAECKSAEELKFRKSITSQIHQLAYPYTDKDFPSIKILPLWHGTNSGALKSLCETGYANLATTDSGFFGKGIYSTHEAEYAYRVYSKGILVMNWVAIFSAYPVMDGDMLKLKGKANYQNYDAHFIPVVPADPNNPYEVNYFPCKINQNHTYTEVVVFESAQCLPRYVVELQSDLIQSPILNIKNSEDFKQILPEKQKATKEITPELKNKGKHFYYEAMKLILTSHYVESLSYLEQAAQENYPAAFLWLGWLYEEGGLIGPQNLNATEAWYQKTSMHASWFQEQINTQESYDYYNLAYCYQHGLGFAKDTKMAAQYYKLAAEKYLSIAQYQLGICFAYGLGIAQNSDEMLRYLSLAASQMDTRAIFSLGRYYQSKNKYSEAFDYYKLAADLGEASAQYEVGFNYQYKRKLNGSLEAVDNKKDDAIKYYKLAADKGNQRAQCSLGVIYYFDKNYEKAVHYLTLSTEQGSKHAASYLGECYHKGFGVNQDKEIALHYYRKSDHVSRHEKILELLTENLSPKNKKANLQLLAEQLKKGELPSDYLQGMEYFLSSQYAKALPYFKKSAESGYPPAFLRLGWLSEHSGLIGPRSESMKNNYYKKAALEINWFKDQAEKNYAAAQYDFGLCCYKGIGLSKDIEKALAFYKLAAAQNYAPALVMLGDCVKKDSVEAASYYAIAADMGFAPAQERLGSYFLKKILNSHEKEGLFYLNLAAEQGEAVAYYFLGLHYSATPEKAAHYYKKSAAMGESRAMCEIGDFYRHGTGGFPKDLENAKEYYMEAQEQGDSVDFELKQLEKELVKIHNPTSASKKNESKSVSDSIFLFFKNKYNSREANLTRLALENQKNLNLGSIFKN